MSAIIEDFPIISLTESGKRYGIEPVSGNYGYVGISLPVGLKDEEESRQLISKIKEMGKNIKVYPSHDHITVESVEGKFLHRKEAWVHLKRGEHSIEIGAHSPDADDKPIIDTILRYTIIGEHLKDYWMKNDNISEEQAQERLEEITPLANKK